MDRAARVVTTMSVNVPPTSTPTRQVRSLTLARGRWEHSKTHPTGTT